MDAKLEAEVRRIFEEMAQRIIAEAPMLLLSAKGLADAQDRKTAQQVAAGFSSLAPSAAADEPPQPE